MLNPVVKKMLHLVKKKSGNFSLLMSREPWINKLCKALMYLKANTVLISLLSILWVLKWLLYYRTWKVECSVLDNAIKLLIDLLCKLYWENAVCDAFKHSSSFIHYNLEKNQLVHMNFLSLYEYHSN